MAAAVAAVMRRSLPASNRKRNASKSHRIGIQAEAAGTTAPMPRYGTPVRQCTFSSRSIAPCQRTNPCLRSRSPQQSFIGWRPANAPILTGFHLAVQHRLTDASAGVSHRCAEIGGYSGIRADRQYCPLDSCATLRLRHSRERSTLSTVLRYFCSRSRKYSVD